MFSCEIRAMQMSFHSSFSTCKKGKSISTAVARVKVPQQTDAGSWDVLTVPWVCSFPHPVRSTGLGLSPWHSGEVAKLQQERLRHLQNQLGVWYAQGGRRKLRIVVLAWSKGRENPKFSISDLSVVSENVGAPFCPWLEILLRSQ